MARSRKCPTPNKALFRVPERAQDIVDQLKERRVYGDDTLGVYKCGKHYHIGHRRE